MEKILSEIIKRHALIVVNGIQGKCTGLITRERTTVQGVEKSVIDFVIVSRDIEKHIEYMHIDDQRKNVLTKLIKTKKRHTKKVESDHNLIGTKLSLPWNKQAEVFNFKDKKLQESFFHNTDKTDSLSKIFDSNKSIQVQTKKFIKRLNGFVQQSFKKVRVGVKGDKKLEEMYDRRRYLRSKDDDESQEELDRLEEDLADRYSESMYNKIKDEIKVMNGDEGGYNPGHLWNLKKKLSPQQCDPPTAMYDGKGNILTEDIDIRNEAVKHFKTVFETKPIDSDLTDHEDQRERLCERRLKEAFKNNPLSEH